LINQYVNISIIVVWYWRNKYYYRLSFQNRTEQNQTEKKKMLI